MYDILAEKQIVTPEEYRETIGKGMEARSGQKKIKVGSSKFAGNTAVRTSPDTAAYISSNDLYKGRFICENKYLE